MFGLSDLDTPVTRDLTKRGIPFRTFVHPGEVRSIEQAAAERGQSPEQVIRSIVFRLTGAEFVMVLAPGPAQISWPGLRAYLGLSRISMATPEEVLQRTGYRTGSVSPFGLPTPMRILVDEKVFDPEEVSIGSGVRNTTVILKSENLRKALVEAEIGCFVEC
jgi:Cys-tRNA(Pro) deacylase